MKQGNDISGSLLPLFICCVSDPPKPTLLDLIPSNEPDPCEALIHKEAVESNGGYDFQFLLEHIRGYHAKPYERRKPSKISKPKKPSEEVMRYFPIFPPSSELEVERRTGNVLPESAQDAGRYVLVPIIQCGIATFRHEWVKNAET